VFDGEAICVIDLKAARATIFKADIVAGAFDISDAAELVAAGRTGEVFLYSVPQNKTTVFVKHSRYVSSVAFSPDGKWIASGSRDRSVRLWSREESKGLLSSG
jgi:WD40 repeat protein